MGPKPFYWLTSAIIAAVVVFCLWYLLNIPAGTSIDTLFQNILVAVAAIGAMLSAIYAFWSGNLAWRAYSAANQPSALFQVENQLVNDVHRTVIHYKNLSTHDMHGLKVTVRVLAGEAQCDISDLFTQPLGLPAGDRRRRQFETHRELLDRGFDLATLANQGATVRLMIGYSHEHGGSRIEISNHQSYLWANNWIIG